MRANALNNELMKEAVSRQKETALLFCFNDQK